ncbi:MAG: TetR family transcriptional regulator [Burkholderiaceae bacterium]
MPRRTKEESARTRAHLIDAARVEFALHGYTRASLELIARRAGVTRGALYFHFRDKADLFRAMRNAIELPLIDRIDLRPAPGEHDPLAAVERFILSMLADIRDGETTRSTIEVLSFGCEYVGEMRGELDQHRDRLAELRGKLLAAYRQAERRALLRAGLTPRLAAVETMAFIAGLVRIMLLDGDAALLGRSLRPLVRAHIDARRRPVRRKAQN